MTVVLGLDQSPTNTGFAIGSPCEPKPVFGLFQLAPWKDDEGARLLEFEEWLLGIINKYGVTDVFHEAPVEIHGFKNPTVTYKQDALIGCIQTNTYRALKKEPRQVAVNSWRARFLGCTKAPPGLKGDAARKELKRMAMKACVLRNWLVENDNTAEALGIWDFGCAAIDRRHAGRTDILARRAELSVWKGEK
jgi:hypothetical protein